MIRFDTHLYRVFSQVQEGRDLRQLGRIRNDAAGLVEAAVEIKVDMTDGSDHAKAQKRNKGARISVDDIHERRVLFIQTHSRVKPCLQQRFI